MGRLSDEDMERLLRELAPDASTSYEFTRRVLEKIDASSSPKSASRRIVAWAAASLVLGALASQGYLRQRYERSRTAERVRELRHEYQELQTELEKLRALTRELEPVLDLGGTEDVGFVFDLRELARRGEAQGPAEPVSHTPSHRGEGEP